MSFPAGGMISGYPIAVFSHSSCSSEKGEATVEVEREDPSMTGQEPDCFDMSNREVGRIVVLYFALRSATFSSD